MVGIRSESFPFQQGQSQSWNKVAVSDHSDHLYRVCFSILVFPAEHTLFKAISLQVVCDLHPQRNALDIRIFKYLLFKSVRSPAPVYNIHLDQILFVQPQIGVLQIMELLEYDSRTNNHGYCDHELYTNQSLDQCTLLSGHLPSFESQQRTERRHIESGESPGQTTYADDTEQHKQESLPIELQSNILSDK